jgi:hypothetical protein
MGVVLRAVRKAVKAEPWGTSRTTVSRLGRGPPAYVMVLAAEAKPSRSKGMTRMDREKYVWCELAAA